MRTVERRAAAAVDARAAELAALMGQVPGVRVERRGGEVVVSGRGVARRVLDEPALRDPAGLLR